jgi:hypothetical protein
VRVLSYRAMPYSGRIRASEVASRRLRRIVPKGLNDGSQA